jgi:hypothetical protein
VKYLLIAARRELVELHLPGKDEEEPLRRLAGGEEYRPGLPANGVALAEHLLDGLVVQGREDRHPPGGVENALMLTW